MLLKAALLDATELWDEYKGLGGKFVITGGLWIVKGRKHQTLSNAVSVNRLRSASAEHPTSNTWLTTDLNSERRQARSAATDHLTEHIHRNIARELPTAMTPLLERPSTILDQKAGISVSAVFCGCQIC